MVFSDLVVIAGVAGLAAWAFFVMGGALRRDAEWSSARQAFVADKGLARSSAGGSGSAVEAHSPISWAWFGRRFSRNPALASPVRGSVFVDGEGALVLDEVSMRGALTSTRRVYVRLSVPVSALPTTLSVRPLGWLGRFVHRLRGPAAGPSPEGLAVSQARDVAERPGARRFLDQRRCRILAAAQARTGGVHIQDGRLYLIRERRHADRPELDRLHEDLLALAGRLES